MGFYRILISSFLLICYLHTSNGQKTVKYEGNLSTIFSTAGVENYNYYVDETNGKKIKQGYYRYTLKQNRGFSKLYKTINGIYDKNLKSGVWTYKITLRDYQEKGKRNYTTATLNLTARYNNGLPDGKWVYSGSFKEREIVSQQSGRVKWDKYQNVVNEKIILNFREGILVDTLLCNAPELQVFGIINNEGFFMGDWSYSLNGKIEVQKFQNGLMYLNGYLNEADSMVLKSNDHAAYLIPKLETIEKLKQESPKKLKDLNYKTDTTILFASDENMVTKIVLKNIFNNPYFLFRYLEGDNFSFNQLKGGYQQKIVNQVSANQQQQIYVIANYRENFKRINQSLQNKVRGKQISDRSKELMNLMNFYERIADKYECMSKALCAKIEFDDAKKHCDKVCRNTVTIPEGLPEFNSREGALEFFINDLENKNKMMETFHQQVSNLLD